jgi:hypothetical protein
MRRLRLFTPFLLLCMLVAACVPSAPTAQPAESPTAPPPAAPAATLIPLPSATVPPTLGPTPQGAWIAVSPQTASPGATVQIQGYLPGGPDQAAAESDRTLQHANLCWQDCQKGFVIQGLSVAWSATQPGNFTIQAQLPAVPYLTADGPHELAAGDYTLGIQCLGPEQSGCANQPAQATTTLHLQGQAQKTCPNSACAELTLSPDQAGPGAAVSASGWAPLDRIIGSLAFGYSIVLVEADGQTVELGQADQQVDGSFTASFVVPESVPGSGPLQPGQYNLGLQAERSQDASAKPRLVAQAGFQVGTSLAWKDLAAGKPAWVQPSAEITGSALRASPTGALLYCSVGKINISSDSKTWKQVSTVGVEAAAQSSGYPLAEETPGSPVCLTALADPLHADSFYATFRTMKADAGAPPVYVMGFSTSDGGASWQAVPVPAETTAEQFGGFGYQVQAIEALFDGDGPTPGPLFAELTRDGGKTWAPGTLACPEGGACLRWGPAASTISGMGSPAPQYVMISGNGGQAWTFPGISVELRAQGPFELAAFGKAGGLLIGGSSDFPLQVTRDGGANWSVISLPALPGGGTVFPGLQLLPDGSLLAIPDGGAWQKLAPGAANWCALAASPLPAQPLQLIAAGDQVWWLTQPDTGSGQEPQPQNTPLAALQCK